MSEFMDVEIYPKEVVIKVLTVDIPIERGDVFTVLNALVNTKKKAQKNGKK